MPLLSAGFRRFGGVPLPLRTQRPKNRLLLTTSRKAARRLDTGRLPRLTRETQRTGVTSPQTHTPAPLKKEPPAR
jgi:hypothetical protein